MFRKGLCVRSPFGLGQIVMDGDPPLIRFLAGDERHIAVESLTLVPTEDFEAEIANLTLWNRFLTLCVCGPRGLDGCEPLWVRDDEGIWTTPEQQRQEPIHWTGPVERFVPDDIGQDARVLDPNDLPVGRDVIDCTVTRVLNHEDVRTS